MKAEILVVVDASGSMLSLREDTIGGIRSLIEEQKAVPGDANLRIVGFNTTTWDILERSNLKYLDKDVKLNYRPSGNTALYDALGTSIDKLGEYLLDTHEWARPDRVIVVVITDGAENASTKFTRQQILNKIQHQEQKYSWKFMYLGANQDAFAVGRSMGIMETQSWNSTPAGTRSMFGTSSGLIASCRT